jgi:hypothetical protein
VATRRGRITGKRGYRPATEWTGIVSAADVAVAAATKQIFGSFVVQEATTVRRTRGLIAWKSDQLAATEQPVGAFGLAVVSDKRASAP